MIVPSYWAESRVQHREGRKTVTIRRFGWSDIGLAEAQVMADERSREAMQRHLSGENVRRREPKEVYGGAEGLPIREEVILRQGDAVITRNGYGALCLNTPDVMFVDVDKPQPAASGKGGLIGLVVVAAGAAFFFSGQVLFLGLGIVAIVAILVLSKIRKEAAVRDGQATKDPFREKIEKFSQSNPEWGLSFYQTPAGYRILITHALFDPRGEEAARCFKELGADPVYARMCVNQSCFRARLSPKPWRIGIGGHLRPRPGVWPVAAEHMEGRKRWVQAYEQKSQSFAACQWIDSVGNTMVHPKVAEVMRLHDEMSRSRSGLPLA